MRKRLIGFFLDAVGRFSPLKATKLGLVGSIQHLHLLPKYKEMLEGAGFEVVIPTGGDRLTFPWAGIRMQLFRR